MKLFSILNASVIPWLPLGIAVTLLTGMVHLSVQQNYRQSANDPQIQLARDGAQQLADGAAAFDVVGPNVVDIATSLAPWIIVLDAQKTAVASSAMLDGITPTIPAGVLQFAKDHGEDRVSWQPQSGVRSATVAVYYKKGSQEGYVISGRSLKEVEVRERDLEVANGLIWAVAMATTFLFTMFSVAWKNQE